MNATADALYMGVALDLARKGTGTTSPNPLVGSVVAKDGRILGRGYHHSPGTPHAEIHALNEAGEAARGADLYVTLEPCSHHGRTGPCAEAIIRAGIHRVVAASADPNPLVSGRGFKLLADAGIKVESGLMREEAERLNEAFNLSIVEKRSFVHLKLAATLDGKIATATGDSRWITSPESRERVHRLRDQTGAVIVGVGTANADDPSLTVRLPGEEERKVLRVVLDRRLRMDLSLRMLAGGEATSTLVICGEEASSEARNRLTGLGASVHVVATLPGGDLDLRAALKKTYELGRMEVLVEGGAHAARAFLDQGLVSRCHFFYAPKILGGVDSLPMVGGASPARIADALELTGMEVERIGPDLYVTGKVAGPGRGGAACSPV